MDTLIWTLLVSYIFNIATVIYGHLTNNNDSLLFKILIATIVMLTFSLLIVAIAYSTRKRGDGPMPSGSILRSQKGANLWLKILISLTFILPIVAFIYFIGGKDDPPPPPPRDNELGLIACYDGYVYYRNISDNGYIYRISDEKDGRSQQINSLDSYGINIIRYKGDVWAYFINANDKGRIYRIKVGSPYGSSKLVGEDSAWYLSATDDAVYYRNKSDGCLYEQKINGNPPHIRSRISDENAHYIEAANGWVYYCVGDAIDNRKFRRVSTKDHGQTEDLSAESCMYINAVDGWIYYSDYNDKYRLYRMRIEGQKEIERLSKDGVSHIVVSGQYAFYCNFSQDKKLYRLDLNNSKSQKIADYDVVDIATDGEWVYFITRNGGMLHRVRVDGNNHQVLENSSWESTLTS